MAIDQTELLARIDALTQRLDALEAAHFTAPATAGRDLLQIPAATSKSGDFWALDGLQARRSEHPSTADGIVMLVGSVTLPDDTPVSWQMGAGTAGLLETEWAERATVFAALGHPVRLEILRHILAGTHETAELAQIEGLGTTGQLHHHLRQLLAAGWLRQSGRGNYEVSAARVVPLLASVLGAER